MAVQPGEYLKSLSALRDEEIDLAEAALALAALRQSEARLERYRNHIGKLCREVAARYEDLIEAGAADNAETRLASLKHIIADRHGYAGGADAENHIENASLIRLIDTGRGAPAVLAILYIHTARAQGWIAAALELPGHMLCRLDHEGRRLIFAPAENCRLMAARDLRALIKAAAGPQAELSASYFEMAANRAVLINLGNAVKFRQIETEDYEGALETARAMRLIDPGEIRLLLEEGVLSDRVGRKEEAAAALEDYIEKAPQSADRAQAALLLREIRMEQD